MRFSLIICTYQRPEPLHTLLESVKTQFLYPDQILIVDGSLDTLTQNKLQEQEYKNLEYFLVNENKRGLTKQRNFGINKVIDDIDIVCFLDDDIVLTPSYFKTLLGTYSQFPEALGVGGYIINEINWKPVSPEFKANQNQFSYDGFVRSDGSRFVLRKKLRLDANTPPAHLPDFAHGRSVSFLPPSGKIYPVEQFMGGVASYRFKSLQEQQFSEYFKGYGLYEDADYTLRLSRKGNLYVNTAAQLYHYHDPEGRPNKFSYGKMVIRNGWYVWRVRHPNPNLKARLKWNVTALLLTLTRYSNAMKGSAKKAAFTEALGRTIGWWSLLINKPKLE